MAERIKLKPKNKRVDPNIGYMSEYGLWNSKMNSKFAGCKMLGRKPAIYMDSYIYYFDIKSKFGLVGSHYPDGAVMIVPEDWMKTDDFEPGIFRLDWHKKRARKSISRVETERRKLTLKTKRERLNGRAKRKKVRTKI